MEEMEKDDIVYFYIKIVETMLYIANPNSAIEIVDSFLILDVLSIFEVLERFLEISKHYLDENMKRNAYHIINVFSDRFNYSNKEERMQMIELRNKLIRMINECDDSKITELIELEWNTRFLNKKLTRRAKKNKNHSIEIIKNLALKDLNLLITHSSIYDDKTFEMCIDVYVTDRKAYMACINALMAEHPNLMNKELFRRRVELVAEKINEVINDKNEEKAYVKFIRNISFE